MKKKLLIILSLLLLTVTAFGTTIAYFTTTSTFNNEFSSKPYSTKMTENFTSPDNWTPGTTTDKTVNVENTGGIPIAVRVRFEEKWTDSDGNDLPLQIEVNGEMENVAILNFKDGYEGSWILRDGWYYYRTDVNPLGVTDNLLESVTFNPNASILNDCIRNESGITCSSTGKGYDDATYVLTVTIETVQADMKKEYWSMPDILYDTIRVDAVADNKASKFVQNENGIDFKAISSPTNGQGIYVVADTMSDSYPIYYYRGAVDNNNVLFANLCWKIVRTTDTGGIKLIYNGKPTVQGEKKICQNTGLMSLATEGRFNNSEISPAYIGYKYGDIHEYHMEDPAPGALFGRTVSYDKATNMYTLTNTSSELNSLHHYTCNTSDTTCSTIRYYYYHKDAGYYFINLTDGKFIDEVLEDMFSNNTDSAMKSYLENDWYENNMNAYTKYLEDTIWCNDKRYEKAKEISGWNPNGGLPQTCLYFDDYYRRNQGLPSFSCREEDSYTVSNGKAKKPVGLITSDEAMYAGAAYDTNESYYLYVGRTFWTMSPCYFREDAAFMFAISDIGSLGGHGYMRSSNGVRPVVSLKSGAMYDSGDGTANNPFVIIE